MRRQEFQFDLPEELIAQHPVEPRSASRLLVMDRQSGALEDRRFSELTEYLREGDLLVFNDTRVIKARLLGRKDTGGRIEILVERLLDARNALAQIRASKSPKPGTSLQVGGELIRVLGREGDFFRLQASSIDWLDLMQREGHVPLPPYIEREDQRVDVERYQTVYARNPGAVAAPTAGLHFDETLLERLARMGVASEFVTLHVGAGTFQPMRSERLDEHRMHRERVVVSEALCRRVASTREAGGRVVAVGTTSVRSLESAWRDGQLQPFDGETDIFIYPGIPLRAIDGLITNFHLPESTLLMLICAFAGMTATLDAYRHAVEQRYRFFSYGDAMLIL